MAAAPCCTSMHDDDGGEAAAAAAAGAHQHVSPLCHALSLPPVSVGMPWVVPPAVPMGGWQWGATAAAVNATAAAWYARAGAAAASSQCHAAHVVHVVSLDVGWHAMGVAKMLMLLPPAAACVPAASAAASSQATEWQAGIPRGVWAAWGSYALVPTTTNVKTTPLEQLLPLALATVLSGNLWAHWMQSLWLQVAGEAGPRLVPPHLIVIEKQPLHNPKSKVLSHVLHALCCGGTRQAAAGSSTDGGASAAAGGPDALPAVRFVDPQAKLTLVHARRASSQQSGPLAGTKRHRSSNTTAPRLPSYRAYHTNKKSVRQPAVHVWHAARSIACSCQAAPSCAAHWTVSWSHRTHEVVAPPHVALQPVPVPPADAGGDTNAASTADADRADALVNGLVALREVAAGLHEQLCASETSVATAATCC